MKLIVQKCVRCGQIKERGKWLYLNEVRPEATMRNLAWLICADGVEWEFTNCPVCAELIDYNPT